MASLTIRNLEEPIKELLRIRAAHHGHSMEEEVRQILRTTLLEDSQLPENLAEAIKKRFAQLGGVIVIWCDYSGILVNYSNLI
jgi:plasmid stability protein